MNIQSQRARAAATFNSSAIAALRVACYIVSFMSLLLLGVSLLLPFSGELTGMLLILLVPGIIMLIPELFFRYLRQFPLFGLSSEQAKDTKNRLDLDASLLVSELVKGRYERVWKLLSNDPLALELLFRLGVTRASIAEPLKGMDQQLNLTDESKPISIIQLVTDWLRSDPSKIISNQRISGPELEGLIKLYLNRYDQRRRRRTAWMRSEVVKSRGIASDWAASYTPILDNFSAEVPETVSFHSDRAILLGRENIVASATALLNKQAGHNLLFVGKEGSGRREIFYHLASNILRRQTKTSLDGMSVRILDIRKIFSATNNDEELEGLFSQLFSEIARYGRLLLYIDQFDVAIDPNGEIGSRNLSSLISSLLEHDGVHIVASVTPETYTTVVKPNATLSSMLTAVEIPEPSKQEMPLILLSDIDPIEGRYRCLFLHSAIKSIATLAPRYLTNETSPSRELTIAEEVASMANGSRVITEEMVIKTIERRSGVPIAITGEEAKKIDELPQQLRSRIIGQTEALVKISNALTRARAGLAGESTKPIGSFLFLGPTGVGKTETAKALADIYFGRRDKLVRLDMTEFADESGLVKLLGSDQVRQPGALTVNLEANPSSVVLLDEFEKCHPLVKNSFLQVLDEGRLTTNFGKVLNFTNTIIIATSNAGSEFISDRIKQGDKVKSIEGSLIEHLTSNHIYLPELLNRFDDVIVFGPLSQPEVQQIIALRLSELTERVKKEKGMLLSVSPEVISQLATEGYDPVFGARALERVIKERLETVIAKQLLSNNPSPGTTITISTLE